MKLSMNLVLLTAVLALAAGYAGADTHVINQVGFAWVPDSLVITVGDTVEWVWSSGSHTVTSGLNPGDPFVGDLLDESLTTSNPMVSHTFTTTGDHPFFRRPHYGLDMFGNVHVEQDVANVAATWGAVKRLFD